MRCVCICEKGDRSNKTLFRVLETTLTKMIGLLFTNKDASPVILFGCDSIHTHFMRYAIDIAFVDREGVVLKTRKHLAPFNHMKVKGSYFVLERPSCVWDRWYEEGQELSFENAAKYTRR